MAESKAWLSSIVGRFGARGRSELLRSRLASPAWGAAVKQLVEVRTTTMRSADVETEPRRCPHSVNVWNGLVDDYGPIRAVS